jgi:hypothetical protein
MFRTCLKGSLGVLPWLLIPAVVFALFIMGIDPYYIQVHTIAQKVVGYRWGVFAYESLLFSAILALVVHVAFALVIPCAIGATDSNIKRFQFFLGFFINLAISLIVPIYYFYTFGLDGETCGVLIVLHFIMFLATFIISSRFVSPIFRRAFWFTYFG